MNTSETVLEHVSPESLGFREAPPNPSPVPRHIAPAATGLPVPQSERRATVSFLQGLADTATGDGRYRKTMIATDRFVIYHYDLPAYSRIPRHHHPEEQFGYICHGAMQLDLNGEEYFLYEGDSYFVPSNVPHALTAISASAVLKILFAAK